MIFRFLVSFHYHRNTDLQEIIDAYGGPCQVFADSGAYSAASLGVTINRNDYAAWLKDWQDVITTAATLDVIGDPAATQHNTFALEDLGLRVLPVFHVGTPWERLEELCSAYGYVALGGMVSHSKRPDDVMRWLIRCFKTGREHGTVFHGFGQARISTLAALPFYSADSSAWGEGSRYGHIPLWDGRRKRLVSVQGGDPAAARKYASLLRQHGADPVLVGCRGFSTLSQRTKEQYGREYRMMRGAPALAYHRFGEWLISRHRVPAPDGWEGMGTHLYLADAKSVHLQWGSAMLAQEASSTRLYLADTDELQFIKAVNVPRAVHREGIIL